MVTRYTIDQILSHGRSSPLLSRHTHLGPTSPPASTATPPTPTSAHFIDTHSTDAALDDLKIPRRPTSLEFHQSGGGECYLDRSEKRDGNYHPEEKTSPTDHHPPCFPTLARPVPLRPPVNMPPHDTPPFGSALGDVRAGLLYGRLGYGMDGGVYGAVVRQYIDAYYRGLPTPRSFLPIPYLGLDPGLALSMAGRSRRRGGQVRFTNEQTRQLEAWFARHKYITPPQRKTIARELNLHERQVKTWFQNRRAKWRKVQAQGGGGEETAPSPTTSHEGSEEDPAEEDHAGEATAGDALTLHPH